MEVDYSNNFSKDLVKAIESYKESNRVVVNTHSCLKIVYKLMVKPYVKTLALLMLFF